MKRVQYSFAIEEAEHLVGRPVVQLFSFVRVDVRNHIIDVGLREIIEGRPFRRNAANHFVTNLDPAFLVGRTGIAVENTASQLAIAVALEGCRIRELAAAIGQNDGKETAVEIPAERVIQMVHRVEYGPRRVVLMDKSEEQRRTAEVNRHQHLLAFLPDYGIHLHNLSVGICSRVCQEVFIGPVLKAVPVNLLDLLGLAGAHANHARKIERPCVKEPLHKIVVHRSLGQHDLVTVALTNVMDRLPVLQQRRNNVVDALDLHRVSGKPLTAFGHLFLVCCLSVNGIVIVLSVRTAVAGLAAVTDVRRLLERGAFVFLKFVAVKVTLFAKSASLAGMNTAITEELLLAGHTKTAGIESPPVSADVENLSMFSYFFGNGAGVFADLSGNLLEGQMPGKTGLDNASVLQRQMGILCHIRIYSYK